MTKNILQSLKSNGISVNNFNYRIRLFSQTHICFLFLSYNKNKITTTLHAKQDKSISIKLSKPQTEMLIKSLERCVTNKENNIQRISTDNNSIELSKEGTIYYITFFDTKKHENITAKISTNDIATYINNAKSIVSY